MKGFGSHWRNIAWPVFFTSLFLLAASIPGLTEGEIWNQTGQLTAVVNSVLTHQNDPNKFYVGTDTGLFGGIVNGGTLTLAPTGFTGNIGNLTFGGTGDDVLLGGIENEGGTVTVVRSTNSGQSFSPVGGIPNDLGSTGFGITNCPTLPSTLVLSGYSNSQGGLVVMQSTNGGANWTNMPSPGGHAFPGSVAIAPANPPSQPKPVAALGTSGMAVVTCQIGGTAWIPTAVNPTQLGWALPGLADPAVSGTLYFGNGDASSNPFGYRLDNYGQSAVPLNFPQGMTRPITTFCPLTKAGPRGETLSTIFAGTEGGKVWRSSDSGATWSDASAGLPGDKINCMDSGGSYLLAGVGSKGLWYRLECSVTCEATAEPTAGPAPLSVQFNASATATGCSGTLYYNWSFGDDSTSVEQNPVHTYINPGTYSWTLTVSAGGTTCTKGGLFTVTPPCSLACSASADPAAGVAPLPVTFTSSVTPEYCQNIPAISWDFGDGGTSSEPSLTHTYASAGIFTWTFTATADGKSCTQSGSITVTSPCTLSCTAGADPASGNAPLAVNFAATYEAPGCSGEPSFYWEFGDYAVSDQQNPAHTYSASGTFTWTFKVTLGGKTCQQSGTVVVGGNLGKVVGNVLIQGPDYEYWWPNGPVVKRIEAKLKNLDTGEVSTQALGPDCYFSFEGKPEGRYSLTATMVYKDNIGYDSILNDMGCLKPEGGWVEKEVTSAPREFEMKGVKWEGANFPPPVVMLHGILECYQKWYSEQPGNVAYWDNAARDAGFISFTPSYNWWGNTSGWPLMAEQVAGEIHSDITGLNPGSGTAGGRLPFSIVAHDAGGLVARVMLAGGLELPLQPNLDRLLAIYIMGTPNSGTDLILGGGEFSPLSVYSIMQRFNEIYQDFGIFGDMVYSIGGSKGLWGLQNGDGRVSLYSAFNIARLECYGSQAGYPVCTPFITEAFDSSDKHIFPFKHSQLGGPSSKNEILEGVILKNLGQTLAQGGPDSPAGGIVWGTNSRTVSTASGNTQGREASQEFPFTLGQSDGMAVLAWVTSGSAQFEVMDPNGGVIKEEAGTEAEPGFEMQHLNPMPGEWKLRVSPGPTGAEFRAVFLEDSPFGIAGYTEKVAYAPGEKVLLGMDGEGLLTDVAYGDAVAKLYDLNGDPAQTVPLYDDGQHGDGGAGDGHFAGETGAPASPGSYRLEFYAAGSYGGSPFTRSFDARLNVSLDQHLFTGNFTVRALSSQGGTEYDAIEAVCESKSPPTGAFFILTGDLYDSGANFVSHTAGLIRGDISATTSGTLLFPLAGIKCSQFSGAFQIKNLVISESHTLAPLDRWPDPVETEVFDPGQFDCSEGGIGPTAGAMIPDEGVRGYTLNFSVTGRNFKDGVTVDLGEGIAVSQVRRISGEALSAVADISPEAVPGMRVLTVNNPGEVASTLQNAFEVRRNRGPAVFVQNPQVGL